LQSEYDRKSAIFDTNHPDMLTLRTQIDSLRASGQSVDALSIPAQLQMEKSLLTLMRQRYNEDHPDVKRIERQIKALEARSSVGQDGASGSRAETSPSFVGNATVVQLTTQINALDTQASELERAEAALHEKLDGLEQRVDESPLIEHRYKALLRDLEAAHTKYDELNRSAMTLEVTISAIASGRSDELRLVQAPVIPEKPAKPRRLIIAGVGTVLAALLGITTVIIREGMDQKIRSSRDVYGLLSEWPLVAIPQIYDPDRVRRKRWRFSVLTACTAVLSAIAIVAGRVFFK
jgi:succinoglycan biosynthesis transport protein ExoP